MIPGENLLNRLQDRGVQTIGVGKISDIFADRGISESHPTKSNHEGMQTIERLWTERREQDHFIFANLVDFDTQYGHRNDPGGYAANLERFDARLADLLPRNVAVQLLRAQRENAASEQGSKMTAMDNATRNAGDLIKKLTLLMNRKRQAMITTELTEIISGAEAV